MIAARISLAVDPRHKEERLLSNNDGGGDGGRGWILVTRKNVSTSMAALSPPRSRWCWMSRMTRHSNKDTLNYHRPPLPPTSATISAFSPFGRVSVMAAAEEEYNSTWCSFHTFDDAVVMWLREERTITTVGVRRTSCREEEKLQIREGDEVVEEDEVVE